MTALACGSSKRTEPADADSALPPAPDDSCTQFGLRFTPGACPEEDCEVPLCHCRDSTIGCLPSPHDRCLTGLDCDRACAAEGIVILTCAAQFMSCTSDAECAGGFCVSDAGAQSGECRSGERGARCRNDQDCAEGNCVAGDGGTRACSPGEVEDLCDQDQDCQSARCRLEGELYGSCEEAE